MILALVQDFADVLAAMPEGHPRRRVLALLDEAVRRDTDFIQRHPTALFQCLWNSCWWYDCPRAAEHYDPPADGWEGPPPWSDGGPRLSRVMEGCRSDKEAVTPGCRWVRMLRPPRLPLGSCQVRVFWPNARRRPVERVAFARDGQGLFCAAAGKAAAYQLPLGEVGGPDMQEAATRWLTTRPAVTAARTGPGAVTVSDHELGIHVGIEPDAARTLFAGSGVFRRGPVLDEPGESHDDPPHPGTGRVAISPDGRWIAVGTAGGRIRVLNLHDSATRVELTGHDADVHGVAFSADGSLLASASEDGTLRLWDLRTATRTPTLRGHAPPGRIVAVAHSPAGTSVATATDDGVLGLWDAGRGTLDARVRCRGAVLPQSPPPFRGDPRHLAFSADGSQVVAVAGTGHLLAWDPRTGTLEPADSDRHSGRPAQSRLAGGTWLADAKDQHVVIEWGGEEAAWLPEQADYSTLCGRADRACWAAAKRDTSELLLFELVGCGPAG